MSGAQGPCTSNNDWDWPVNIWLIASRFSPVKLFVAIVSIIFSLIKKTALLDGFCFFDF
jgi:hypothetical protein